MDLKTRVKSYLGEIKKNMLTEITIIDSKINIDPPPKNINSLTNKKRILQVRERDCNMIIHYITIIEFIYNVPENIKPLLSPHGTFCDREKFYYDPRKLENLNDKELTQIVCCEIFNVEQSYYHIGRGNLKPYQASIIHGISLLMMYHIGLIKEKIPYAQSQRNRLISIIQNKYPLIKVESFEPNFNAAKYLFEKMLLSNECNILGVVSSFNTVDVIEYEIRPIYWFITQYGGIEDRRNEVFRLYFTQNENMRRVYGTNKIVKEHRELVNLTKKLMGV